MAEVTGREARVIDHRSDFYPAPSSDWPVIEITVVVRAFHDADGCGADDGERFEAARTAYLAVGGSPREASNAVRDMLASLLRDHGTWPPETALRVLTVA